jgi:subtilisin family serine protease
LRNLSVAIGTCLFIAGLKAGAGEVRRAAKPVRNSYVVVLNRSADRATAVAETVRTQGIRPIHLYDTVVNGFSFVGSDDAARAIANDPRVQSVYESAQVVGSTTIVQSPVPSWGLDRIDQVSDVYDNTYHYDYDGSGVVIYVVDSGITDTPDLNYPRVRLRLNFSADANGNVDPHDVGDCIGHGTYVAGVAAGRNGGVAKRATVVSVRVLVVRLRLAAQEQPALLPELTGWSATIRPTILLKRR